MTNPTAPESTTSAHIPNDTDTESSAPGLALNAMGNATPPALQTGDVVPVTFGDVKVGEATVLEDGSVSVQLYQHKTFGAFRNKGGLYATSFSFDTEEGQ